MKKFTKIAIPLAAISIAAASAITPVSAWVYAASDGAGATTSNSGRQTTAALTFSDDTGTANYGTTSAYISSSSYSKNVKRTTASVMYGSWVDEFDFWPKS